MRAPTSPGCAILSPGWSPPLSFLGKTWFSRRLTRQPSCTSSLRYLQPRGIPSSNNIRDRDMTKYTIRFATPVDAAIIARHRVAMFRDMGEVSTEALAAQLLAESTAALTACLHDQSYIGWLAADDGGAVIGGAGVHIKPQLPRVSHDGARVVTTPVPLAANVYTEPEWRARG